MDWLAGAIFALFTVVRLTATRFTARSSPEHATDLTSWYRAWTRDSSQHPATAAELRHMLEMYRRARRTVERNDLPDTKPAVPELDARQPVAVGAR
jgi:hypothetical protein